MPVVQPEVTNTQSHQERDAAFGATAQLTHDTYERYFTVGDFVGDGGTTYPGGSSTSDPPAYVIKTPGATHANIVFLKPSYWWNGNLKLEVFWLVTDTDTNAPDIDLTIASHRVGSSGDVTTLYSGTPAISDTPNGTAGYIYESEILTTSPLAEEDDIIHIEFVAGNNVDFGLVGVEVEYKPEFIH